MTSNGVDMRRSHLSLLPRFAVLLLVLPTTQVWAGKSASDYWQDTEDYFTAPLRWKQHDWTVAGGVALGIGAAYSVDSQARDQFNPVGSPHKSGARDALPLAAMVAGTFAVGVLGGKQEVLDTAWDMGEAIAFTSVSTQVLKLAAGRQRPFQSDSPRQWGKGGSSFPSGHTSVAFAAAQVLADELPREQWRWRILAYGLAGATAIARLDSNAHWFSDTVAGAALGIATGRFVSRRGLSDTSRLSLSVVPEHGGAMMTFSYNAN